MIGRIFPSWIERTVNGTNDYAGATFLALLLKSSYTFDATDVFISDLTPGTNELSGGSYARVSALSGRTISRTGSITKVTWSPIVFGPLTATGSGAARSMIIAMVGASDAASPLVLQQDFETASDSTSETITVTPSSSGFVQYTSSP